MRLSHALVAGLTAATSLFAAAPASAVTTTYEAEDAAASVTSGSWSVARSASASGLRFVQLNSRGSITFAVPVRVRAFYAVVRSQDCADPSGQTSASYTYEGHPSYWQEDPYFTGWPGTTAPPPAGLTWGGGTGGGFAKITSPPRGWSPPSPFHPDPALITVNYTNDFKGGGCDRNFQIDALKVVS